MHDFDFEVERHKSKIKGYRRLVNMNVGLAAVWLLVFILNASMGNVLLMVLNGICVICYSAIIFMNFKNINNEKKNFINKLENM